MESTVFQVRPNSPSLRATVPEAVAKTLKLKHGDKLVWEIEVRDGQLIIVVKKAET
jgi:bifunctional DNA-binding transcriptional regulator/antitoxin component of YhaV-PrlF toxin-antitoxin module